MTVGTHPSVTPQSGAAYLVANAETIKRAAPIVLNMRELNVYDRNRVSKHLKN